MELSLEELNVLANALSDHEVRLLDAVKECVLAGDWESKLYTATRKELSAAQELNLRVTREIYERTHAKEGSKC